MRNLIVSFCVIILLVQCQKEVSVNAPQTASAVFEDSLVGTWKYVYDYRLTSTQANPDVIIDSLYSGNYTPYSYFTINSDSTFRWWRSESKSLPMFGWGVSGKVWYTDSIRAIALQQEKGTHDNFGPNTFDLALPFTVGSFHIKYLSNDSMVLFFRQVSSPDKYYYWHDVYVK